MPLDFPWPLNDQSNKVLGQLRWNISTRIVFLGVGSMSKLVGGNCHLIFQNTSHCITLADPGFLIKSSVDPKGANPQFKFFENP